ncbi:MAG: helix-turn-helix transcriptional regulator [Pseudomonadota bacterium]
MSDIADDFILDIYNTVANPAGWPGVLDRLCDDVGARTFILFELVGDQTSGQTSDQTGRRLREIQINTLFDRAMIRQYMKMTQALELEEQDRVEARATKADEIDIVPDSAIFPDEASLTERPNVKALMALDIRHRAFGLLEKDTRMRGRFSVTHSPGHGPMRAEEAARLAAALPHIAKALSLGRPAIALAAENRRLIAAMDRLGVGVCILDNRRRVALANAEFDRQKDARGAFQVARDGRLSLTDAADNARLDRLIDDLGAHGRCGARPRKEAVITGGARNIAGRGALCIEVAPLERADDLGSTRLDGAILYIVDAARPLTLDIAPLRAAFALTAAEAAIAELLCEGLTNAEMAERRGRSTATINMQVRTLLAKTDCANRTQFARLALNFGMDFMRRDNAGQGDSGPV